MNNKYNSALGAYEKILKMDFHNASIGIGTGSTTDIFTKNFLNRLSGSFNKIYSTSKTTSALIEEIGLTVSNEIPDSRNIDVYVDGADEVDGVLNLIKGGGGAHAREKMVADASKYFICIVDSSKSVKTLGAFGVPVEIMSFGYKNTINKLSKFSDKISIRDAKSQNGNIIADLKNMVIENPLSVETAIKSITGVIEVGIFAKNKPDLLIIGDEKSYESIDASISLTIDWSLGSILWE